MKIKLYIVTYNNKKYISKNLDFLIRSDLFNYRYEINIINNHSCFSTENYYEMCAKVLHNDPRPDFSTGHLARNWNQGLINGFQSLVNPDCDIVVLMQDDTWVKEDCFEKLVNLHDRFSFIHQGRGDNFMSFTTESVRHIGIFDERFCGIMHQETDYFLRALLYNREKSSINDNGKHLNYIGQWELINPTICGWRPEGMNGPHGISLANMPMLEKLLIKKYECDIDLLNTWREDFIQNPPREQIISFMFYPYFEKDVYRLTQYLTYRSD